MQLLITRNFSGLSLSFSLSIARYQTMCRSIPTYIFVTVFSCRSIFHVLAKPYMELSSKNVFREWRAIIKKKCCIRTAKAYRSMSLLTRACPRVPFYYRFKTTSVAPLSFFRSKKKGVTRMGCTRLTQILCRP